MLASLLLLKSLRDLVVLQLVVRRPLQLEETVAAWHPPEVPSVTVRLGMQRPRHRQRCLHSSRHPLMLLLDAVEELFV